MPRGPTCAGSTALALSCATSGTRDLRVSQVFKSLEVLEAAATEKRQELEARGWHRSGWSRQQSFPSIDSVVSQALNERAQCRNHP